MKFKLQNILLVTLIITNVFMLFILVKQPHKSEKKAGSFLVEQLGFDNSQEKQFLHLDRIHRDQMMVYEDEIQMLKKGMFKKVVDKVTIDINYYSKEIGRLEAKKEVEIYRFFSEIRSFCTQKQEEQLNEIFKQIIDKKNHGRRPPPPHGERPPHPTR